MAKGCHVSPPAMQTIDDHDRGRRGGAGGNHRPQVLPGGTHLLYTMELDGKRSSDAQIIISALDGSDRRVLIAGGSARVMSRPGTPSLA